MFIKQFKAVLPLLLVTILGAIIRFYQITTVPPSLNWDEVSHGYNAYSLLKTGKDEWGISFPLIFRAFGDYKLPAYIYLTTIPVAIFGLNTLSVRFISVIAGILAIPGIYLLANELFSRRINFKLRTKNYELQAGLVAAFLLALNPWHFFISRPALEANLGLTLFIFSLWSLLKAIKSPRYWLLGSLLLSLTLHTYNSYRVMIPLLLPIFFLIHCRQIKLSKTFGVAIVIFLLSFGLMIYQFVSGSGTARYSKLAILSESAVYQVGQNRLKSQLPQPLPRLVHNRPVYFLTQVSKNYLSYFSPAFLYQTWGPQYQFAIPGKNLLTLPVTILVLIGLAFTLKNRKSNPLVLLLLLLTPVPTALTADPPQSLRPTPMIVPLILLATIGGFWLLSQVRKYSLWLLAYLIFIVSLSFSRYLFAYFTFYPRQYADSWQYGYQQAIEYLNQHRQEYQRLFFTKKYGEPHIFYVFYSQLDPRLLQPGADNIRFVKSNWFWTDKIQNVYFVNHWQIPSDKPISSLPLESGGQVSTDDSLLITTLDEVPTNAKILKVIKNPDNLPVFVAVTFK